MVLSAPSDVDWDAIANYGDVDDVMAEHQAAMASFGLEDSSADSTYGESSVENPEPADSPEAAAIREDPFDVARELETNLFPPPLVEQPGRPLPYSMTTLGSLPDEIKAEIFGWVLGLRHRIDLTVPHAKYGQPRLWFSSFFPDMREPFSTYLRACPRLRQEGIEHLLKTTVFINRFSDSAKHFPKLYGNAATAMIQHFELHMHFINKIKHEMTWPALFNMLVDKMPNLKKLTAISTYLTHGQTYPLGESGDPTGSVTRHEQERRSLLRFGAFLTLRHPTLKVMVIPATSGSWYRDENNEHKSVIKIEIYPSGVWRPVKRMLRRASPTIEEATEHADIVMNSTAIRRLKWTELAKREPTTLTLAVDANTSEVPEEHDFYRWVDLKGYMTYQKLGKQKLGGRQEVDKLIDLARRDGWQAAIPPVTFTIRSSERGAARGGRARGYSAGGRGCGRGRGANMGAGGAGLDIAVPNAADTGSAGRGRGYLRGRGAGRGRGGRGSQP